MWSVRRLLLPTPRSFVLHTVKGGIHAAVLGLGGHEDGVPGSDILLST